jgi:hypothetical protein
MFEFLGTVASSILGGGVTGLFGVAVQRIFDYKNKHLDIEANEKKYAHEINSKRVDAEIMQQEWAARTRVAEIEVEGRSDVAQSEAFSKSFNEPVRYSESVKPSKGQGWMLVILDFIRGIVRPGLTIYLCVVTTMIYLQAHALLGTGVDPKEALELVKMIVGTELYLCTTCVLWWFGTRNKGAAPKLGR